MNKSDYKKVLVDVRNSYIEQKRILEEELDTISDESFNKQREYLEKASFNLLSSGNVVLNNIGRIIAYKLFGRKTNKKLLDISCYYIDKYETVNSNLENINNELINLTNYLDSDIIISDKELKKYMLHKVK